MKGAMRGALFAAAGSGVLVGAAIVASRFALQEVPPLTLALLRYAIGALCLLPFVAPAMRGLRIRAIPGRDLWAMAALGVGQFAILITLLNLGLRTVSSAHAALIFSLFPLITLLIAAALGREAISPRLLGGVLLSIAGVALSLSPKLAAAHGGHWWGEAAVLASAGIGALCSVLYRPYLQRYPTVPVSAYAMLASVIFLGVIAIGEDWPSRVTALSAPAWAAIAFIGLASGAGYFCWLHALKHETPTRVTVFLALNPVAAAALAWIFLGEPVDTASLAALALIFAGLWLATRPSIIEA